MRRLLTCILILSGFYLEVSGQDDEEMQLILDFKGLDNPEELNEEDLENFSDLLQRPLRINIVSISSMTSSGLLSHYQAVSIKDYIRRTGNILSKSELAAVDGFGEDFVARLAPFISFDTVGKTVGPTYHQGVETDIIAKSGGKYVVPGDWDWYYGLKAKVTSGRDASLSFSFLRPYSSKVDWPSSYSFNLYYPFKKINGSILLGDFNARFGQGLVMWNGMGIGSLTSPTAFVKNPVGLSRTWSYSAEFAMTGVGASVELGRFRLTGLLAAPGLKRVITKPENVTLLPALNVGWFGRYGEVSVTYYMEFSDFWRTDFRIKEMQSSIDTRWCLSGVDIFSELAFDWVNSALAVLAGTTFPVNDELRMSAMLRYYQSDYSSSYNGACAGVSGASNEYGVSLAGQFNVRADLHHTGMFSFDASHLPQPKKTDSGRGLQFKAQGQWKMESENHFSLAAKTSFRYRTWGRPVRTELRADFQYQLSPLLFSARVHTLHSSKVSLLGYVEAGLKLQNLTLYLKEVFFMADEWDDRIYVYERDAPGSFNVPACYGRGSLTSAVLSYKCSRWGKFFLRASYTAYPFMPKEKRKPGKAELKFQMSFSF